MESLLFMPTLCRVPADYLKIHCRQRLGSRQQLRKTFILRAAISHLERAVRGRSNGPNSFHSEMHNAGAASGRDAALRFSSTSPNDYCFFHIRQSARSSRGCSNMLGCPFFLHLRDPRSHQHPRPCLRMRAGAKTGRDKQKWSISIHL